MTPNDPMNPRDENPYAPPETDPRERAGWPSAAETGYDPVEPFSIDNVVSRAWRIYKKRLGNVLAIVLGVGVLNLGFQLAGNVLLTGLSSANADASLVFFAQLVYFASNYALNFFLAAGQTVALLRLARDREAPFNEVFSGGRFFWRILGSSILVGLLMIPLAMACALPAVVGFAATYGVSPLSVRVAVVAVLGLAGLAGIIAISVRLMQYIYVLVDEDCGVVECIQGSFELTRGHAGELFLLGILSALIGFSGLLACGVGLFLTIPLATFILPCSYICLTGRGAAADFDPKKPLRTDIEFIDFTS